MFLIPGDFLAHNFQREFDAAASDHSAAAYRAFVRKTIQFLGQQLKHAIDRKQQDLFLVRLLTRA